MKNRKWHVVYAILIFTILISLSIFSNKISIYQKSTFSINLYVFWLIMFLTNFIFGLALGIERLLKEKQREGKWSFNFTRIVLLGLPSLIMGLYYFIYYSTVGIITIITNYLPKFMIQSSMFIIFNQILLGYVLITNFTKKNSEFEEKDKLID